MMYRIFYNYEKTGDVLFLVLNPGQTPKKVVTNENVTALYDENEALIGVNVFNLKPIIKLHSKGMIATPGKELLMVLNTILENAGLPVLEETRDSGYVVVSIKKIEEHPLDSKKAILTLTDGKGDYETIAHAEEFRLNEQLVALKDGFIGYDGSLFRKTVEHNIRLDLLLLTERELRIGPNEARLFRPEGYEDGDDFFLSEDR